MLRLTKLLITCEICALAIFFACLVVSIYSGNFFSTLIALIMTLLGLPIGVVQCINHLPDFEKALGEWWEIHRSLPQRIKRSIQTGWKRLKRIPSSPLLVILAILVVLTAILYRQATNKPQITSAPPVFPTVVPKITDLFQLPDEQLVGLSDGSNVFDLAPRSGSAAQQQYCQQRKLEGADAFKKGNILLAHQDWNSATSQQCYTNDAETLIYLEDLNVEVSSLHYVTFVFVTQLTGSQSAINRGRDDLQGAYVALKEFNTRKNAHVLARLLVANIGDEDTGVDFVKSRILLLASDSKLEPTFAGVIGWPERTAEVDQALSEICKSHVPIITISSAIDANAKSDCDFSVAPSSDAQAAAAADFAVTRLHAKRASIIYDPANAFSKNMAEIFGRYFRLSSSKNVIVDKESYTLGSGVALGGLVRATLRGEPDVIYFVGYPNDIGEVFQELQKEQATITVLSTDILYQAPPYASTVNGINNSLYFTAFAYPDEWSIFQLSPQPMFIRDYGTDFDPDGIYSKGTYGFERADSDVLITYDAMSTALEGSQRVLGTDKTSESPQELLQALHDVKFQGISGFIQFDARGNDVNKPVIVVKVNVDNKRVYAQYIKGSYTCNSPPALQTPPPCTQFLQ